MVEGHAAAFPAAYSLIRMKQPDYANYAAYYDYFELAGFEESEELNIFLNELFKINKIKSVVDFACGTGAQSLGLAKYGYRVTAADLSSEMLQIARKKAEKHKNIDLIFRVGNMVEANFGIFDAAICIFNAIGHLTRQQCRDFFANAWRHLEKGGLFVVDIFNLQALVAGSFEEYGYMSRELLIDGQLINHVRNCELDEEHQIISIRSKTRRQNGTHQPEEIDDFWQMQVYEQKELKSMLKAAGFKEIAFFGPTGSEFEPEKSDIILAVCQK